MSIIEYIRKGPQKYAADRLLSIEKDKERHIAYYDAAAKNAIEMVSNSSIDGMPFVDRALGDGKLSGSGLDVGYWKRDAFNASLKQTKAEMIPGPDGKPSGNYRTTLQNEELYLSLYQASPLYSTFQDSESGNVRQGVPTKINLRVNPNDPNDVRVELLLAVNEGGNIVERPKTHGSTNASDSVVVSLTPDEFYRNVSTVFQEVNARAKKGGIIPAVQADILRQSLGGTLGNMPGAGGAGEGDAAQDDNAPAGNTMVDIGNQILNGQISPGEGLALTEEISKLILAASEQADEEKLNLTEQQIIDREATQRVTAGEAGDTVPISEGSPLLTREGGFGIRDAFDKGADLSVLRTQYGAGYVDDPKVIPFQISQEEFDNLSPKDRKFITTRSQQLSASNINTAVRTVQAAFEGLAPVSGGMAEGAAGRAVATTGRQSYIEIAENSNLSREEFAAAKELDKYYRGNRDKIRTALSKPGAIDAMNNDPIGFVRSLSEGKTVAQILAGQSEDGATTGSVFIPGVDVPFPKLTGDLEKDRALVSSFFIDNAEAITKAVGENEEFKNIARGIIQNKNINSLDDVQTNQFSPQEASNLAFGIASQMVGRDATPTEFINTARSIYNLATTGDFNMGPGQAAANRAAAAEAQNKARLERDAKTSEFVSQFDEKIFTNVGNELQLKQVDLSQGPQLNSALNPLFGHFMSEGYDGSGMVNVDGILLPRSYVQAERDGASKQELNRRLSDYRASAQYKAVSRALGITLANIAENTGGDQSFWQQFGRSGYANVYDNLNNLGITVKERNGRPYVDTFDFFNPGPVKSKSSLANSRVQSIISADMYAFLMQGLGGPKRGP